MSIIAFIRTIYKNNKKYIDIGGYAINRKSYRKYEANEETWDQYHKDRTKKSMDKTRKGIKK